MEVTDYVFFRKIKAKGAILQSMLLFLAFVIAAGVLFISDRSITDGMSAGI